MDGRSMKNLLSTFILFTLFQSQALASTFSLQCKAYCLNETCPRYVLKTGKISFDKSDLEGIEATLIVPLSGSLKDYSLYA